jgi:CRISPR-associated protein Csm4
MPFLFSGGYVKTYQITIKPLSPFGTPLKGDTLFGHFCWQAAYSPELLNVPLGEALQTYDVRPFAVFSSVFSQLEDGAIALKRPDMPLECLFDFSGVSREERITSRKKYKERSWLLLKKGERLERLKTSTYSDDADLKAGEFLRDHNSINRTTGTTGSGEFAPFTQPAIQYPVGGKLAFFVGIVTKITDSARLCTALENIGAFGFGRDATTGMGRFAVVGCEEIDLNTLGSSAPNALYTLGPCVPCSGEVNDSYFTPFTRYGRHGDRLARSRNPFKSPIILADEGAVFVPTDMTAAVKKPYVGQGIRGISKAQPEAVAQGYSLFIPVQAEVVQ